MTNLPPEADGQDDGSAVDGPTRDALWRLRARLVTPPATDRAEQDLAALYAAAAEHRHDDPVVVQLRNRRVLRFERVGRVAAVFVLVAGTAVGANAFGGDGGTVLVPTVDGSNQGEPVAAPAYGEGASGRPSETPERDSGETDASAARDVEVERADADGATNGSRVDGAADATNAAGEDTGGAGASNGGGSAAPAPGAAPSPSPTPDAPSKPSPSPSPTTSPTPDPGDLDGFGGRGQGPQPCPAPSEKPDASDERDAADGDKPSTNDASAEADKDAADKDADKRKADGTGESAGGDSKDPSAADDGNDGEGSEPKPDTCTAQGEAKPQGDRDEHADDTDADAEHTNSDDDGADEGGATEDGVAPGDDDAVRTDAD